MLPGPANGLAGIQRSPAPNGWFDVHVKLGSAADSQDPHRQPTIWLAASSLRREASITPQMSTPQHGHASANPDERRRSPRLEVLAEIHGHVIALDVHITLLNISQGGFLMQAPVNFPVGAIHDFRFTARHREPVVLPARIVHAVRATAGGTASYVMGLEFVDRGTAAREQAIEGLIGVLQR